MLNTFFNTLHNTVSHVIAVLTVWFAFVQTSVSTRAHKVFDGTRAEAYVDTGVKILIAVVIGALLMAGLYTLFNTTIMPTVTEKVQGLFNYAG